LTTKIVVNWGEDDLFSSPREEEGNAFINRVLTKLGDGWEETNMRVRDTKDKQFGKILTSLTFLKPNDRKVVVVVPPCHMPRIRTKMPLMP
jgi:hypothetical protein